MRLAELFYAKNPRRGQSPFRRRKSRPSSPNRLVFEPLEARVLLDATPLTIDMGLLGEDLAVRVQQESTALLVEIVDTPTDTVLVSRDLTDTSEVIVWGSETQNSLTIDGTALSALGITFYGGAGDDTLRIDSGFFDSQDGSLDLPNLGVTFVGGAGSDRLISDAAHNEWVVDGADSGHVVGPATISFSDVEQLTGAGDNEDTFVFQAGGSLGSGVDGGDGGFDTLEIAGGSFDTVTYTFTGPDSGTVALDGTVISYIGLEPVVNAGDAANVVITASGDADTVVLEEISPTQLQVSSINGGFETHVFNKPSTSLRIDLGTAVTDTPNLGDRGADTITFNLIDSGFGADVIIDGDDSIIIGGGSNLNFGGNLTVMSGATITVEDGASLATSGGINFFATALRELNFATLDFKDLFVDEAEVGSGIDIGNASLSAANIVLGASASASKFAVFDIFEAGLPALIEGNLAEMSNPGSTVLMFNDNGGIDLTGAPVLTFIDGGVNGLTGNPELVFAGNGAGPGTITRASGSWIADGFASGQLITVEGSQDNDLTYRVAGISADGSVLTIEQEGLLVDETATGVTVTSPSRR